MGFPCWAPMGFGGIRRGFACYFRKIELSRGSEGVRRSARTRINAENHGESIGDSFRSIPERLGHQNPENHDFAHFCQKLEDVDSPSTMIPTVV